MLRVTIKRSFWSGGKLAKLESLANEPSNRTNPSIQRDYFRELLRSGNAHLVISRFECSAVQSDADCLKLYIASLAKENKLDRMADRHLSILRSDSPVSPSHSGSNAGQPSQYGGGGQYEAKRVSMQTNLNDWDTATGQKLPPSLFPSRKTPDSKSKMGTESQPISVILSESWSWASFSRTLATRVFYGLLVFSALAVLLEQQGMMRSGLGKTEVEASAIDPPITFDDVQGVDEAKAELQEVVDFLKNPHKFLDLGGKLPKGVLLHGPPGTGKTHLARAVAGEAGVPFFQMSGSQFDELYVGVGARRVRDLFAEARKRAPCIVFIDELDAVASKRSMKDQSYMRQTLNQLLVELDGFSSSTGVIFIGATNTPESLDKALTRPGRLDRLVPVPLPDVKGRTDILKVHMRGVKMNPDIKPDILARGTPGFSGADLANLVNHAAIHASSASASAVRMSDLEWAKDKIIMGAERKSSIISKEDLTLTAYHEGGHTLVTLFTKGATPLHKVTIIPRGSAAGVTVMLPKDDSTHVSKRSLFARMDVAMGGRVAEELIFGTEDVCTGASSDLSSASNIARRMIMDWGMNEKVGLINLDDESYLSASPELKNLVDSEINSYLTASYGRAMALLKSKKNELHLLANALLEHETLSEEEVKRVIKGESIRK